MRFRRAVLWTLAAFLGLPILGGIGVATWIRVSASRKALPDRVVPFYEPPAPLPRPSEPVSRFRVERRGDRYEIVDALGRTVLLRGVTMGRGAMLPPFEPISRGDEDAFRQLKAWGVNAIRLPIPWEALETAPRTFDLDRLGYIRWFLDAAARHGMVVRVDNHQHGASRCFGGAGAPLWAIRPGTVSAEAEAARCRDLPAPGPAEFPRQMRYWADFYDGLWTPDDLTAQDHVIWAFVKLAEVLRGHPALLGYGLMDAPPAFLGSVARLLYPGETDGEIALSDFYRRFATALRNVDPDALLFFEPPVRMLEPSWDGTETGIVAPSIPGMVFSVRFFGDCDGAFDRAGCRLATFLDRAISLGGERFGTATVLTDFGAAAARSHEVADLGDEMVDIEDARVSAFAWSYAKTGVAEDGGESLVLPAACGDGTAACGLPRCHAAALVRPYPVRIAGVLLSLEFDRAWDPPFGRPRVSRFDGRVVENTDAFRLRFAEAGIDATTLVFVPRVSVYGEDSATEAPEFTVDVSDGTWEWSPTDPNLLLWTTRRTVSEHSLMITTWGGKRAPGNGVGDCR